MLNSMTNFRDVSLLLLSVDRFNILPSDDRRAFSASVVLGRRFVVGNATTVINTLIRKIATWNDLGFSPPIAIFFVPCLFPRCSKMSETQVRHRCPRIFYLYLRDSLATGSSSSSKLFPKETHGLFCCFVSAQVTNRDTRSQPSSRLHQARLVWNARHRKRFNGRTARPAR